MKKIEVAVLVILLIDTILLGLAVARSGDAPAQPGSMMSDRPCVTVSVAVTGPEGEVLLERDIRSCFEGILAGSSIDRCEGRK